MDNRPSAVVQRRIMKRAIAAVAVAVARAGILVVALRGGEDPAQAAVTRAPIHYQPAGCVQATAVEGAIHIATLNDVIL